MSRLTQLAQLALLALHLLLAPAAMAKGGTVHSELPKRLDPGARYVLYLHGRIIEEQGPRPKHPEHGVYEYRQILDTLAAPGFTVISEQRRPGTDMDRFADHVTRQVQTLLAAKVPPERITVIGFSKGGGIATRTSALLKNDKVNFVFLAACGDGSFRGVDRDVRGRILSIYEESDDGGRSCAQLFAGSKSAGKRQEIKIRTGECHGAFYRPRKEWVAPVLAWIRQER